MEYLVYGFLLLILFLGVLFNLKITNESRVAEIKKIFIEKQIIKEKD